MKYETATSSLSRADRTPSACHCPICSNVTLSRISGTIFRNSGAAGADTAAIPSVISRRRSRVSAGTLFTVLAASLRTPAASITPVITSRRASEIRGARCGVPSSIKEAVAASNRTVVSRHDFSATICARLIKRSTSPEIFGKSSIPAPSESPA